MALLCFLCQDMHAEAVKKRRRTTKKPYSRSIVGATLEVIQKRRTEKPEVRDAAREAALRYIAALSHSSLWLHPLLFYAKDICFGWTLGLQIGIVTDLAFL